MHFLIFVNLNSTGHSTTVLLQYCTAVVSAEILRHSGGTKLSWSQKVLVGSQRLEDEKAEGKAKPRIGSDEMTVKCQVKRLIRCFEKVSLRQQM